MMRLVFADEASEFVHVCVCICVCWAWRSMIGLVFADEALVSVSLQTSPHYWRRDNCTAIEEEKGRGREVELVGQREIKQHLHLTFKSCCSLISL